MPQGSISATGHTLLLPRLSNCNGDERHWNCVLLVLYLFLRYICTLIIQSVYNLYIIGIQSVYKLYCISVVYTSAEYGFSLYTHCILCVYTLYICFFIVYTLYNMIYCSIQHVYMVFHCIYGFSLYTMCILYTICIYVFL